MSRPPTSGSFGGANSAPVAKRGRGRPKGTRNPFLADMDKLARDAAPDIIKTIINNAQAGDMKAAELMLKRAWPERKGRPVDIDIPTIANSGDLPAAMNAIVEALSDGRLTPEEAASIGTVLEMHRKAIETADMDERLRKLEANMATPTKNDDDDVENS